MNRARIAVVLALRNLVRQPRRTAIAVSAVVFGIVALMLASGFIEWIYFDMRESTIHARLGHVQIVRPGYYEGGTANPSAYLLPGDDESLKPVAGVPGVVGIAPRISFSGLVSRGETTLSFVGEGVDPARETELSKGMSVIEGVPLAPADTNGVLLGAGLARALGARVGDRVVLLVNRGSGGIDGAEVDVRGVFTTISKAYDDSALRVPIGTARRLLAVRGAHVWTVLLDDTTRTDAAVAALRERLPGNAFQVVPWYDLADFYNKTVALFSRQLVVVKLIVAAIIVLSISNSMTMSVIERTGEIGTAMALGVSPRGVLQSFMTEGALLGAVSGVMGVAIGLALAALVSAIGIPMPPPPGMAHGFIGQIRLTPPIVIEALALAVATTLAATLYPAWKGSRLAIVDALRHNR